MGKETDRWPFIGAKYYTEVSRQVPRQVLWIVIHDMEYPEKLTAAEDVARYFQRMPDDERKSAHICVDADSIVQCVADRNVAYAAPGANSAGIQIELAGYARQSASEWLDGYGLKLLQNGANAAAQYCVKYNIPPVHISNDDISARRRGIIGHGQASAVFKQSTHTDPGPHFPWQYFMEKTVAFYQQRIGAA